MIYASICHCDVIAGECLACSCSCSLTDLDSRYLDSLIPINLDKTVAGHEEHVLIVINTPASCANGYFFSSRSSSFGSEPSKVSNRGQYVLKDMLKSRRPVDGALDNESATLMLDGPKPNSFGFRRDDILNSFLG